MFEQVNTSTQRVQRHTAQELNEKILRQMQADVTCYASRLDDIERRLRQLDNEWDTERTLECNAGALMFITTMLGLLFNRKWHIMSAGIGAFLFQHAVQGWCPPLPVIRRMGIRTPSEIEKERYALKALRGDFKDITADGKSDQQKAELAMQAVDMT